MKVGCITRNGPLDRCWTRFQWAIGDPAQFLQLDDPKVVSLLLHKTNRAEQRQLGRPSLWTGPQSAWPEGTAMWTTFSCLFSKCSALQWKVK